MRLNNHELLIKLEREEKMKLENIKMRLEKSKDFHYYRDTIGISWKDFKVVNINNGRIMKQGSKEIGEFGIFVDGDNIKACYDLTVDGLAEDRLKSIGA